MAASLQGPQYAVVAYIKDELGHFVEELRTGLHPEHSHLHAHITVLPPRRLAGTEQEAIELLRRQTFAFDAFEVNMDGVETFSPVTPTVFLRVGQWAHKFRDLHDRLNAGPLFFEEQWPYMPHLTIVKMPEFAQVKGALAEARRRWNGFRGRRSALVQSLSFVREGDSTHWQDLATLPLRGARETKLVPGA